MKTILKSTIVGLLFASIAFLFINQQTKTQINVVQTPVAVFQDCKAINLPEDGVKYYTSCYFPDDYLKSAQCRAILSWFETEPRLASLKQTTHFTIYKQSDPLYKERYAKAVGKVPCVALVDSTGKTLFITRDFPTSSAKFADLISESTQSTQGWRRDQRRQGVWNPNDKRGCPFPQPEPKPEPQPTVPEPVTLPQLVEDTPVKKHLPVGLVILAGVIGAGLSLASEYKKEQKE